MACRVSPWTKRETNRPDRSRYAAGHASCPRRSQKLRRTGAQYLPQPVSAARSTSPQGSVGYSARVTHDARSAARLSYLPAVVIPFVIDALLVLAVLARMVVALVEARLVDE
eukprot:9495337-Pyramimonas_sp.AAC.1